MSTVTVAEVRLRLNKTLAVDDVELQSMIDAAEAEYVDRVGPVVGPVTEVHDGGQPVISLTATNPLALTAASYASGATLVLSQLDLDVSTGLVHWDYGTVGYFLDGTRNVTLTFTIGPLPAHHREAIIADVAGYFAATQRGPSQGLPGEGYEAASVSSPRVLFPRIAELAVGSFA